ncbi:MAG: O-antigen ligase family protein, partial [Oscillospiraceae bacterium]|nr:O-antigen ligase family protein [Oscillospiraceae bacterium]
VPLIGIGATLVITAILDSTAGKDGTKFESGLLNSSRKRLVAIICALAAVFGIVFATQGIYLRDKAIAYTDAYYRLFIVAGSPSPINDDSHWEIGADRSLLMIKEHPLLGVGPDMFAKEQFTEELAIDSIDRSYNEYLYIAATRGIPSLVVYLALLGVTVYRLIKDAKQFTSDREKWFRPALLTVIIAYSIQAFFSASNVTVAPFFWLLLGLSHSKFNDEKTSEIK